jgi:translation initiation factor IF-3
VKERNESQGREATQPVNEKIRHERMQLISAEGQNLGIFSRDEALREAARANLDLVLLAEQGGEGVPVARIMDFGKTLYAKKKQQADAKKKQQVIQIKELKLRPKISEHDYQTKMNQGIDFLTSGKRLKITLMFKGREAVTREERGAEMFDKIQKTFEDAGIMKHLVQEKDAKSPQAWSRVYYSKK